MEIHEGEKVSLQFLHFSSFLFSFFQINYSIYCHQHTPLRLKRLLEIKHKKTCEEIVKFLKNLEKFSENVNIQEKLKNVSENKKYLQKYLSKVLTENQAKDQEFTQAFLQHFKTLPEYQFVINMKKEQEEGEREEDCEDKKIEKEENGGAEEDCRMGDEGVKNIENEKGKKDVYHLLEVYLPKKVCLKVNISRNDDIWKSFKYKNYNPQQLFKRYRKIVMGNKISKDLTSLKKLKNLKNIAGLTDIRSIRKILSKEGSQTDQKNEEKLKKSLLKKKLKKNKLKFLKEREGRRKREEGIRKKASGKKEDGKKEGGRKREHGEKMEEEILLEEIQMLPLEIVDPNRLYCICRNTYTEGELMLGNHLFPFLSI